MEDPKQSKRRSRQRVAAPSPFSRIGTEQTGMIAIPLAFMEVDERGERVAGSLVTRTAVFQWRQRISRVYELGSQSSVPNVYRWAGPASGEADFASVVGPQPDMRKFHVVCGTARPGLTNSLAFIPRGALHDGSEKELQAGGCRLEGIGFAMEAEQMVVDKSVTLSFERLGEAE